jgi:anti-sigma regulatory factor (Ser/Thr protein kinase)
LRHQLRAVPDAPSHARRATGRALADYDARIVDTATLLVSELVSNSVRHAGLSSEDRILLDIAAGPSHIRVTVTDDGPGFEFTRALPSTDLDSGWGLYVLQQLSDRCGLSANGSSEVWFELDLIRA